MSASASASSLEPGPPSCSSVGSSPWRSGWTPTGSCPCSSLGFSFPPCIGPPTVGVRYPAPYPAAACLTPRAPTGSHALGRTDPEQGERPRDRALRDDAQAQPQILDRLGLRADDLAVAVEGGEHLGQ